MADTKKPKLKAAPAGGKGKKPAAKKAATAKPAAKKKAPAKKTAAQKAAPAKKTTAKKAAVQKSTAKKTAPRKAKTTKAMVTGANGFIGSVVARKLLEQGVAVVAPVRAGSDHSRLAGVPVELVQADINDSKSVAGYLGDVDIVYHVAGAINAESQEAYDAFNVDAAVALAQEALRENPKLKRFVYISSIAATGPSVGMLPRLESSASNPQTPYGISKVRGEVALKAVKGLPLSIVRPPIVLGPTDGATLPFYQMGQTGLVLGVLGLDRRYSWVDVDDLARGIILAGTHPAALGETFHLTHEDSLGIVEVQEKIVEAYGKTPVKILIPELILWGAANMAEGIAHLTKTRIPLDRSRVSELTENNWVMDSHKAERVLGWTAEITLETCVHRSLEGNREAGLI